MQVGSDATAGPYHEHCLAVSSGIGWKAFKTKEQFCKSPARNMFDSKGVERLSVLESQTESSSGLRGLQFKLYGYFLREVFFLCLAPLSNYVEAGTGRKAPWFYLATCTVCIFVSAPRQIVPAWASSKPE